jgi:hypothetical protein
MELPLKNSVRPLLSQQSTDPLERVQKVLGTVTPAKAGVQKNVIEPGFLPSQE